MSVNYFVCDCRSSLYVNCKGIIVILVVVVIMVMIIMIMILVIM